MKRDFAFTQGNVISNTRLGTGPVNAVFIAKHEEPHIWQSRIFGPIFRRSLDVRHVEQPALDPLATIPALSPTKGRAEVLTCLHNFQ